MPRRLVELPNRGRLIVATDLQGNVADLEAIARVFEEAAAEEAARKEAAEKEAAEKAAMEAEAQEAAMATEEGMSDYDDMGD